MRLVQFALVPILEANGFMVPGNGAGQAIYCISRTFSYGDCSSPLGILAGKEACPFLIR